MTHPQTDLAAAEFAELRAELADGVELPPIQRRWLSTPTGGGHVSGVFWHEGLPRVLLLHDAGFSARDWDGVLLALGRPAVAVDLPGHGRSNRRGRGDYRPRRLAGTLVETAHSFAPAGVLVVGHGLGALVAIAANAKKPGQLGRLVLVDTLPGSLAALGNPWPTTSPDFADQDAAHDWLAARTGDAGGRATQDRATEDRATEDRAARTARLETTAGTDGRWTWRHHLGSLPDGVPTVLDDDTLWTQLASAERPLLVRTVGGPLDGKAVERFAADVPGGQTATVEPGPAALAALLAALLP